MSAHIPESHLMPHPTYNRVMQSREATYAPTAPDQTWTRHCPACRELMQKTLPLDSWVCTCGWRCP